MNKKKTEIIETMKAGNEMVYGDVVLFKKRYCVVLDAFIFVFTLFCVARYSGLIYRRMLMFPERKNTPIEPYN